MTWIELRAADSTIRFAVPLTEPDVAVMVTTPADCPKAAPAVVTVATFVSEEDQLKDEPMDCFVPSLNVPVAMNCKAEPGATSPELGVNAIEVKVALLMLSWADPVAEAPAKLNPALIVAVPELTPVAEP